MCVVPKLLTLYTHQRGMGKKNKVVKLTERKIRYIIRAKIRGESTKRIAQDMKLSPSSVKRVWMHWTKTKMPLNIKKFGRKKKPLDEESEKLILEVSLMLISESFDAVEASTKSKILAQDDWKRSSSSSMESISRIMLFIRCCCIMAWPM